MKDEGDTGRGSSERGLIGAWNALPLGARTAFEQQWAGLAAGGLPCGSAVVSADGIVVAAGRNHAYDEAGGIETRALSPLQHTRLAHAEFNAIAKVPTEIDPEQLTLWSTQHPCAMCAAAVRFVGIGAVYFIADDPSDDSSPEAIVATRRGVNYQALGDSFWWTVSNLLFLYTSAVQKGENARSLRLNQARYPDLVRLTLALAKEDVLGRPARSRKELPFALSPHAEAITRVSQFVSQ